MLIDEPFRLSVAEYLFATLINPERSAATSPH